MWISSTAFHFTLLPSHPHVGDNHTELHELWLALMALWIWSFKSVTFFYPRSINLCLSLGIFSIVWRIRHNERLEFLGDAVLELISRWEYVGNLFRLLLLSNLAIIFLYDLVFLLIWSCLCYTLAFTCISCCHTRLKEVWPCTAQL